MSIVSRLAVGERRTEPTVRMTAASNEPGTEDHASADRDGTLTVSSTSGRNGRPTVRGAGPPQAQARAAPLTMLMAATNIAERGITGARAAPSPVRGAAGRRVEKAGEEEERTSAPRKSSGERPGGRCAVEEGRPAAAGARCPRHPLAPGEPLDNARAASSGVNIVVVESISTGGIVMRNVVTLGRAMPEIQGADEAA